MKKCFTYLMAVLFVGLIFTSCKSNDNVDSNLLGKWSVTSIETVEDGANIEIKMDGNNYMFFTFSSEGKYFQDVNAYGEKWDFSASLLQIICFSMMWYPVHSLNLNLLQIKGRSDLFLKLEIIKKIMGISILCISIPLGIVAMCYFNILTSLIALFINTYYTGKLINVGYLKQMRDIAPTLLLSMVMWGAVLFIIQYIPNKYIQLPVGILIGAAIYLSGAYLLKFQELKEVFVMYNDLKKHK